MPSTVRAMTPASTAAYRLDRRALAADDCDELGRVHMAVWRDAYAGLMPGDYLAGLSDERCADTWRVLPSARPMPPSARSSCATAPVGSPASRVPDPAVTTTPTEWELYAVNLAPAARGTGVADRLLDELVGERDATLWVVEGNARACAFYARRGFVDEGGRSLHDETGAPEIRMIRRASRRLTLPDADGPRARWSRHTWVAARRRVPSCAIPAPCWCRAASRAKREPSDTRSPSQRQNARFVRVCEVGWDVASGAIDWGRRARRAYRG